MKNTLLTAKRAIIMLALLAMGMAFTGCRNTAEGMGQDIERAGEEIQEKVD